jgi:hypothetical protein
MAIHGHSAVAGRLATIPRGGASIDSGRFATAAVSKAYEYWRGKCTLGRLPCREDLIPEEMRVFLPHVFLVDVTHTPLTFRFRLVGTEITQLARKEYTGLAVDEQDYGPDWRRVFDRYAEVVIGRCPQLDIWNAPWVSREFLRYERLIAPLSSDGRTINMLFGGLCALPCDRDAGRAASCGSSGHRGRP